MKNISEQKKIQKITTSLLLCMSAGVLLATSMLNILPGIRKRMEEVQESLGISWLAELVVCAGFFLAYIIDETAHIATRLTHHRDNLPTAIVQCNTDKQCHSDMEMSETDSSNTKYNPKYEVKFSMSTSAMFPNYHSPDSIDTGVEDENKSAAPATNHQTGDTKKLPTSGQAIQTVRSALKGF